MTSACAVTTGATANSGACSCGSPAVTNPNTAKMVPATTAAGLFCYFSKNLATGADNTQASVGKCAKRASVEGVTSNEVSTCTTFDSLNGCAKDKVCFNTGGKNVCAVPACVEANGDAAVDGSAAVAADRGCGDNNAYAATGKFCNVVSSFGFVSDSKTCANDDGTAAASGGTTVSGANVCTCGTATAVQVADGKFCKVVSGVGYVSDTKTCDVTNGATGVAGPCTCGTTTPVQVANTKFCTDVSGVGYASDTKKCSNLDGTGNVDAACTCGTATAVQVANGKVCSVTTAGVGTALDALCANTQADGSTAATAACSCGTVGTGTKNVATAVGKFCRVVSNAGFVSDTKKCDVTNGATGVAGPCTCGTTTPVQVANTKFCREASGVGYASDTKTCSNLAGTGAVDAACTCGTTTTAQVANTKYCYEDSAGKGWGSDTIQCSTFTSGSQADGTTVAAQACSCGTLAATKDCDFCWHPAGSLGYLGKAAWANCVPTTGVGPHLKGPQKCKCGNGAVATGGYCSAGDNGALPACTNNDGTVPATAKCACIKAATSSTLAVAQVAAVGKLCTAGVASTAPACTNDGSTTAKLGANAAPCTCGSGSDVCTAGQICRASATTKCAAFSPTAAPTAAPTVGAVTIVQKLTMSGAQTEYAGNVKSLAEEAYGKALAIFDTAANPPAYKTGCSVTSVASARRAYAVTFTATTSASTGAAANTANTAYSSVTAATANSVAAATATAVPTPTPATVSGASTVTTSIMAMAVAVLAAFQARQ